MSMHYIKSRIASILFRDSTDINLLLTIAGLLMSFGFAVGTTNNNYSALTALMPFYSWALIFIGYTSVKLYNLVCSTANTWVTVATSAVGIWAWNYIFLSFTVFDSVPTAPTEFLLLMPVLCEAWGLTSVLYRNSVQEH